MSRGSFVLVMMVVLVTLSASACLTSSRNRGDIVLLSVDTLRADHMSSYGYPRATTPEIDALFADGTIFDRAYATSSYTTASMVSVLSGLLPQNHGVRLFDQLLPDETMLVTEMLPARYQKAAFVSNGVLSDGGLGVARRFDHFDDTMERRPDTHGLERSAAATTDAVIAWLEQSRDPERALFLWVHYMDPHAPYAPPAAWSSKFDRGAEGDAAPEEAVVTHARRSREETLAQIDDYDREIAYTDAQIGRLMRAYDEIVGLDRSLVILTSDHGETLAERPVGFRHAYHVYEELVRVPLMMRGPGVGAGRVGGLVSGIDLLPTMLGFAGVEASPALAGVDLRRDLTDRSDRIVFSESINTFAGFQWRAAIAGDRKWAVQVRPDPPHVRKKLFFDLTADRYEHSAADWPSSEATDQTPDRSPGRALLELVRTDPAPAAKPLDPKRGELTARNLEALRALGYVE